MKFIDCHFHIPENIIDNSIKTKNFGVCENFLKNYFKATKISKGICIFMNEKIWCLNNLKFDNVYPCSMFDFKKLNKNLLNKAHKNNCRGLKIHPYIQQISKRDRGKLKEILGIVEKLGWYVIVDTSYGGENIYKYNPLEIAFFVAENFKNDVIFAHGGGIKILEGFLIAETFSNVWLEYSLTLPYYIESPVWEEIFFVIKKYNGSRILFGSDSPYVAFDPAEKSFKAFSRQFNLSNIQKKRILVENPNKFLRKYYE